MEDYIERVRKAAAERKGEPVFNGSIDHARVIASAMFKNARKSVDIFSGRLDARVYGPDDVLDEAEFFLSRDQHVLRILLEEADDSRGDRHPFFKRFAGYSNIELRILPESVAKTIPFHLLVADDDCYRFEQDKRQAAAIAAWGDDKGGKNLKAMFDTLWDVGEPIDLVH